MQQGSKAVQAVKAVKAVKAVQAVKAEKAVKAESHKGTKVAMLAFTGCDQGTRICYRSGPCGLQNSPRHALAPVRHARRI